MARQIAEDKEPRCSPRWSAVSANTNLPAELPYQQCTSEAKVAVDLLRLTLCFGLVAYARPCTCPRAVFELEPRDSRRS